MKNFLRNLQQWLSIWIGIVLTLSLSWAVYAWVWMIASDWDSLTHTKWNEMVGYTVPSGAVMSFDLASCPTGWTEYTAARGRAVIWVWQWNTAEWGWLGTNRTLGAIAWAETHTLTEAQMPAHNHLHWPATNSVFDFWFWISTTLIDPVSNSEYYHNTDENVEYYQYTSTQWGSQAHNNMPPSIALLYCKKD
jgi:hypothetical protein